MRHSLIAAGLALIAASSGVAAQESPSLYLGAWSKHLDGGEYNETHNLTALEYKGWLVGNFTNSYNDHTEVVGYGWDLAKWNHWNFRLYAGATYGYRNCYGEQTGTHARLCPALVPELSYTKYRVQPTFVMLGSAVAVTFKFKF